MSVQLPDLYDDRLSMAEYRVVAAADAFCWDAKPETQTELRHAVAEWRTALGLVRLRDVQRGTSNTGSKPE